MSSDLKAECQAAFQEYDTDKSGFIDKLELALVCGALGESLTGNELEVAFKQLDASGDGKISFDEFFAWWSNDSQTHTKATGVALQGLRARALAAKGAKYLMTLFASKLKDGAGDQKDQLELSIGEMKEAKMGVNLSLTTSDVIGKGKGKSFGFDFTLASRDSLNIIQSLVDVITEGLKLPMLQMLPFGSLLSDASFSIDTTNFPTVRLIGTIPDSTPGLQEGIEQLAMVWPMIAGASASLHFGFSFADLATNFDTITIQDLLSLKAGLSLSKLPLPEELVTSLCHSAAGLPLALGLDVEIEGLADLAGGDKAAKLNPTKAINAALEFMKDKAPFPLDGPIFQTLVAIGGSEFAGAEEDKVAAMRGGLKMAQLIIGRDLVSLDRLAFFDADNSVGLELNLINVLNVAGVFQLANKVFDSVAAMAKAGGNN